MNWSKRLRTCCILFVFPAAVAAGACGSIEQSPAGPTPNETQPAPSPAPSPTPAPAPAPAPAPNGSASFSVTVTPNPVPWSNEPVPNCDLANRWHYDQVIRNTGSEPITVSDRADFFNGAPVSARNALGIALNPGEEFRVRTRWCSASNTEHRAQTNWSGSGPSGARIDVHGVVVRLSPRR